MKNRLLGMLLLGVLLPAPPAAAQLPDGASRMVDVEGSATRVMTLGLETRADGDPVLIIFSGAGTPLEAWGEWLTAAAEVAPLVAYDRPGTGGSPYDGKSLAPERISDHLDALLSELDVGAPFIPIGHSWGGPLMLHFAGRRGSDIVGMVYLDPKDPRETRLGYYLVEDDASVDRNRAEEDAWYFARMEPPPGVMAEMEAIRAFEDAPVAQRGLPDDPPVPTALLLGTAIPDLPDDAPSSIRVEWFHRLMQRRLERLPAWIGTMEDGTVIVAADAGHFVQRDVPELALTALRRVVEAARSPEP